MTAFELAERRVGEDAPVFIIAEAGVNHDGDVGRAVELVDAAAHAGADAVKFQTFDPAALASESAPLASYQRAQVRAPDQRAMLEALRLGDDDFAHLVEHARRRGVIFLSSPFDELSLGLLDELGVPAYKLGSGELTNLPFVASVAARRRPVIASTGMADMAEVDAAVAAMRRAGAQDIALLHCVSSYPCPPAQANLRAMDALAEGHPDCIIGYSDHCTGLDVSLAAVARGAKIIERHLTLDRSRPGPDHATSSEPEEMAELVVRVREVESALGSGIKQPQPAEREIMAISRRSIVAARDLRAGEYVDVASFTFQRPGDGLPPSRLGQLIGRRLACNLPAGARLRVEDLAEE